MSQGYSAAFIEAYRMEAIDECNHPPDEPDKMEFYNPCDIEGVLSPSFLDESEWDCLEFMGRNMKDLIASGLPPEDAGRTFWLHRSGQGDIGFAYRDARECAQRLANAANTYPRLTLWEDRRGQIYSREPIPQLGDYPDGKASGRLTA